MKNRRRKGLSQAQLAEVLGESEAVIQMIEKANLPENAGVLVKKLEQFFQIRLRKITEMEKTPLEEIFRIKYVPHTGTIQQSLRDWIENYRKEKNSDPLVYVLPDAGNYIDVKNR